MEIPGRHSLRICSKKPLSDRPTAKHSSESSSRNMAIFFVSLICFCSLFTLASAVTCTPVYQGPRVDFDELMWNLGAEGDQIKDNSESSLRILVYPGITFNLTCSLSMSDHVQWRLTSNEVFNNDVYTISPTLTIPSSDLQTTKLIARNVGPKHSGEYKCVGAPCSNPGGNAGLYIRVIDAEKPIVDFQATTPRKIKVNQTPKEPTRLIIPATIGQPGNISCIAKSNITFRLQAKWRRQEHESKWLEMDKICKNETTIKEDGQSIFKNLSLVPSKTVTDCSIVNELLANGYINMTIFFTTLAREDFGNYSCGITNEPENNPKTDSIVRLEAIVVRVKRQKTVPKVREPPITYTMVNKTIVNIMAFRKFKGGLNSWTVTEGEQALIYCNLTWPGLNHGYHIRWSKDDIGLNETAFRLYSNLTQIEIANATMTDRGMYKCTIVDDNEFTVSSFHYQLRIKSKMAALWPFIAICVEVGVICLIILVYEKTKSKDEIADSDTDRSPDQKVSDNEADCDEVLRLQQKE